jgi:hypothetical protein
MSTELEVKKWAPPTIAELTDNLEGAAKDDVLNIALNQNPPQSWILEHPMVKVKVKMYNTDGNLVLDNEGKPKTMSVPMQYIPVDKQRLIGKRLFGVVQVEIRSTQQMFNSVCVTVRLHYKHPITGEALFMDGVGSVGVQTDAGAVASDMSKIKLDGVMKAAPAAAAYAEKNAYDKLGRLFGGEIQKDAIQFNENVAAFAKAYYDNPTLEDVQELYNMKKDALTADETKDAERIINTKEHKSYKNLVNLLKDK